MADPNPEYEIGYVKSPEDRAADPRNANPTVELISPGVQASEHEEAKDPDSQEKARRRLSRWTQQLPVDLLRRLFHSTRRAADMSPSVSYLVLPTA